MMDYSNLTDEQLLAQSQSYDELNPQQPEEQSDEDWSVGDEISRGVRNAGHSLSAQVQSTSAALGQALGHTADSNAARREAERSNYAARKAAPKTMLGDAVSMGVQAIPYLIGGEGAAGIRGAAMALQGFGGNANEQTMANESYDVGKDALNAGLAAAGGAGASRLLAKAPIGNSYLARQTKNLADDAASSVMDTVATNDVAGRDLTDNLGEAVLGGMGMGAGLRGAHAAAGIKWNKGGNEAAGTVSKLRENNPGMSDEVADNFVYNQQLVTHFNESKDTMSDDGYAQAKAVKQRLNQEDTGDVAEVKSDELLRDVPLTAAAANAFHVQRFGDYNDPSKFTRSGDRRGVSSKDSEAAKNAAKNAKPIGEGDKANENALTLGKHQDTIRKTGHAMQSKAHDNLIGKNVATVNSMQRQLKAEADSLKVQGRHNEASAASNQASKARELESAFNNLSKEMAEVGGAKGHVGTEAINRLSDQIDDLSRDLGISNKMSDISGKAGRMDIVSDLHGYKIANDRLSSEFPQWREASNRADSEKAVNDIGAGETFASIMAPQFMVPKKAFEMLQAKRNQGKLAKNRESTLALAKQARGRVANAESRAALKAADGPAAADAAVKVLENSGINVPESQSALVGTPADHIEKAIKDGVDDAVINKMVEDAYMGGKPNAPESQIEEATPTSGSVVRKRSGQMRPISNDVRRRMESVAEERRIEQEAKQAEADEAVTKGSEEESKAKDALKEAKKTAPVGAASPKAKSKAKKKQKQAIKKAEKELEDKETEAKKAKEEADVIYGKRSNLSGTRTPKKIESATEAPTERKMVPTRKGDASKAYEETTKKRQDEADEADLQRQFEQFSDKELEEVSPLEPKKPLPIIPKTDNKSIQTLKPTEVARQREIEKLHKTKVAKIASDKATDTNTIQDAYNRAHESKGSEPTDTQIKDVIDHDRKIALEKKNKQLDAEANKQADEVLSEQEKTAREAGEEEAKQEATARDGRVQAAKDEIRAYMKSYDIPEKYLNEALRKKGQMPGDFIEKSSGEPLDTSRLNATIFSLHTANLRKEATAARQKLAKDLRDSNKISRENQTRENQISRMENGAIKEEAKRDLFTKQKQDANNYLSSIHPSAKAEAQKIVRETFNRMPSDRNIPFGRENTMYKRLDKLNEQTLENLSLQMQAEIDGQNKVLQNFIDATKPVKPDVIVQQRQRINSLTEKNSKLQSEIKEYSEAAKAEGAAAKEAVEAEERAVKSQVIEGQQLANLAEIDNQRKIVKEDIENDILKSGGMGAIKPEDVEKYLNMEFRRLDKPHSSTNTVLKRAESHFNSLVKQRSNAAAIPKSQKRVIAEKSESERVAYSDALVRQMDTAIAAGDMARTRALEKLTKLTDEMTGNAQTHQSSGLASMKVEAAERKNKYPDNPERWITNEMDQKARELAGSLEKGGSHKGSIMVDLRAAIYDTPENWKGHQFASKNTDANFDKKAERAALTEQNNAQAVRAGEGNQRAKARLRVKRNIA